jgi:ADP-ribose pyrophosphatase YjhB (NUDIX family)
LLPGGRVKDGERLGEALLRAVREEIGLSIEVRRLLYVAEVSAPHQRHDLNLIFLGEFDERLDGVQLQLVSLDPRQREETILPPVLSEVAADVEDDFATTPRFLGNIWDPGLVPGEVEWS